MEWTFWKLIFVKSTGNGASGYLKTMTTMDSKPIISLLMSKTRVFPIKQISIPRLELNVALLLTQLVNQIINILNVSHLSIHFWSDSTIALSWIKGHTSNWTTFIANLVSLIKTAMPNATWHHGPTKENPADLVSRDVKASHLWWIAIVVHKGFIILACSETHKKSTTSKFYFKKAMKIFWRLFSEMLPCITFIFLL